MFVVFHDAMPALAKGARIMSVTRAVASLRRLAGMLPTLIGEIIELTVVVLRTGKKFRGLMS